MAGRLRSLSAFLVLAAALLHVSRPARLRRQGRPGNHQAPRNRAQDLYRRRDHRRIFPRRVRRRIPCRRRRRPHPQIRDADPRLCRQSRQARPARAARRSDCRHPLQGAASRHRDGRQAQGRQCGGDAGARPRHRKDHQAILRAASRARRSSNRSSRNACPVSRRTNCSASSIPTSSSPSMPEISSSTIASTKKCCSRSDRSTTTTSCPGPCSTTTSRWASSTSTISIILNLLYDPRIRAGMSKDQVKEILPKILPDVRAWITKVNGLKDWHTGNARTVIAGRPAKAGTITTALEYRSPPSRDDRFK